MTTKYFEEMLQKERERESNAEFWALHGSDVKNIELEVFKKMGGGRFTGRTAEFESTLNSFISKAEADYRLAQRLKEARK